MGEEDPALEGDELGVELGDLHRCGVVSMPNLAARFGTAARAIPDGQLEWVYSRATDLGLGDVGPYRAWRLLADQLSSLLTSTEASLRDCAENMVRAAKDYAAVDEAAAEVYRAAKRRIEQEVSAGAPR